MYSKIFDFFSEVPTIYTPSTSSLWDDKYISTHILDAHLTPDFDSGTRNLLFVQESADWIANMRPEQDKGNLLDLGCGPGIYSELFCKASFNVTGIDFSKRSIEYATKNAAKAKMDINYLYQSYLDIDYNDEFDVVTLIYCDFGVLPPDDRLLLLRKIRKSLKKNGILILDGFAKHNFDEFFEGQKIEHLKEGFWRDQPHICVQRNCLYPETQNSLEQFIVITQNDCQSYYIWNQIYDVASLSNELKTAGFEDIEFYDDVSGKPLSNQSKTICAVAKNKVKNC